MKDKKGFTLIELLAVVVILGVLLLIAVPSVSNYISDSKKSSYIRTAEGYIDGVRNMITSREISVRRKDTTFYIPIECIDSEKGGEDSPYGKWTQAFVVVTYGDSKYEYYWTSTDENNMGVRLAHSSKLSEELITPNISSVPSNIGVKPTTRSKIMKFEAVKEGDGDDAIIKCEFVKDSNGVPREFIPGGWVEEYGSL